MRTVIAFLLGALLVLPVVAVGYARTTMMPSAGGAEPIANLEPFLEAVVADAPQDEKPAAEPAAEPRSKDGKKADKKDQKKDEKPVTTTSKKYSRSGYDITPLSRERVAELAKKLDPEAYRITQKAGTEPAFCGTLLDNKKDGTYCCVVCGLPLFSSNAKFNSGTGWPSFFQPFDRQHVGGREDGSHGMERIEIFCTRCSAHLGHVFDDGPRPTGLRFCLNGAALKFYEKDEARPAESMPATTEAETAYFAGGCFWGIEHYFQQAPGVFSAESGYMQGSTLNPSYKEVCEQDDVAASNRAAGFKGHAEVVKVVFDPKVITYRQLLEGFFEMHDPTQLNRQGPDYGTQYRSGLYTVNDAQASQAKAFVAELAAKSLFNGRKIVTEIEPAKTFYAAEDYHQDYLEKNPSRGCHIGKPWWLTKQSAPASATN
ncbi:MAG: Peptide methionine sulfoxide reductase MsrA 2 [Planctomycetota bacterium]|jgi:peptide methionine sulfoxide reductase msrA/msrB